MSGVKTNWREHMAHRKLGQKPCAHIKQKHKHMASKQFTSHVQNKTRTCHTAQDITWMHTADKNTNCVQHNKTHVDRRACGRANSRPHTHTKRQNVERECPNPDTKPKLKTWVPGSEHHAPTWNKVRRRESALTHENRTWREYQGSVTKPWITLDRSDRTLTIYVAIHQLKYLNIQPINLYLSIGKFGLVTLFSFVLN